ncbi:hypothetical protein FJT64_021272 [Amphibalanus amphitrite]|uniref:G-protein coupled receptors family 1 profile domain-containing protein n=1 Tax=Amphibalanus amphitrite TaxID=1232801 RepID=A0A6A4WU89_AMPAM|nr:hypothetical protein FJT64_021272 [Amphibalanus amphitrite]
MDIVYRLATMQPAELYGWVAAAAAAPLQATLAVGLLCLLHAGRARWRTVDLFLVAVVAQQLVAALLALGFSLLRLMRPEAAAACAAFAWGWTALRTLQASTVASMAADRVLTAQWPYKYRYSVRRNQIRYHIGVLATVAVLVGTAALFSAGGAHGADGASVPAPGECTFLPYRVSGQFGVFLLSLHVLLAVLTVAAVVAVQVLLCLRPRLRHAHSDLNPLNHTASDTSASSAGAAPRYGAMTPGTAAGVGVATLPHPVNRRRRRAVRRFGDFRWPTVALVTVLCHVINHLPYLVLLVFGTFLPDLLPDWPMETIAVWLSLAEGILLAPLLVAVDPVLRLSVRSAYTKHNTDEYPGVAGPPFRGRGNDPAQTAEAKFPITNGSLFSLQDGTSLHAGRSRSLKMGVGMLGEPANKAPRFLPTLYDPSRSALYDPSRSAPAADTRSEPLYSDPITKAASLDSIIKCLPPGDEPIYATLSTGRRSPERCNSATTIANDDFEFRGVPPAPPPRPSLNRPRAAAASSLKRKLALSMNDLDVAGVAEERPPAAAGRMSCYGVPCVSETDLSGGRAPAGDGSPRQRASPRATAQRAMRYKKSAPRRRSRDAPVRSAIVHRQGHSLLALSGPRAEHRLQRAEIVSVEALNQAMALTPYSYLDNGEVYRHHSRSVPDFQKVFISGFL